MLELIPLWAAVKPPFGPLVDLIGATATNFLLAAGIIAIAASLGTLAAKQFRMPEHGWKFGLVVFAVLGGALVTYTGWPPKLGIDLSGGVVLVYQLDEKTMKDQGQTTVDMGDLVTAVGRRVNPDGLKEVTIRPYGPNQIEIIIPLATEAEVEQVKNTITNLGTLEFRILANHQDSRHTALIERSQDPSVQTVIDEGGNKLGRWVPLRADQVDNYVPDTRFPTRKIEDRYEILVALDAYDVTGDFLGPVKEGVNEMGQPAIDFSFNVLGAQKFGSLTFDNQPDTRTGFKRNLAVILDNEVCSAPTLNSVISSHGQIEGEFTPEQIQEYLTTLRAGKLPASLEKVPNSQSLTGPTLGADTIRTSRLAMVISTALVLLFMLCYYRFAGIVACFALLLNLLLILAIMISIKAAFTLPGLAGLVLTIGMAVDANILIFERIREEQARGATLRMAIRNGFGRAMTAIVDSNVTTIFSAIVLYVIGTDQVKGFAVTMFLGIGMSLFTGVFCSRVIFDIAERLRWIERVNMMKLLTTTNIDFFGLRNGALVFSSVLIVLGLVGVVSRGKGILGIDFLGGTRVEVLFRESQDIAAVRSQVESAEDSLPDVTVSDISVGGEAMGRRFMVDTTESSTDKVKQALQTIFAGKLATNALDDVKLSLIASVAPPAEVENAAPPTEDKPDSPPSATPGQDAAPGQDGDGAGGVRLAQAEAPPAAPAPDGKTPLQPKTSTIPAVDSFAGGTQAEIRFAEPIHYDALKALVAAEVEKFAPGKRFSIQNPQNVPNTAATFDKWTVKIDAPQDAVEKAFSAMRSGLEGVPVFPSGGNIGGAVASSTMEQAIYGLIASSLSIVIYLWVRFQKAAYGVAAVVALVHDVLIMLFALAASAFVAPYLGFLMIEPFKIDLPITAAFLTIIGFSVNDTIVIFDRIRELKGKSPYITTAVINQSVNQTLSRTILTFFTAFISVSILYVFGGSSIHGFAFAMLMGLISGTYSTVYIASPVLLWMGEGKPEPAVAETPRSQAAAAR